jgi:hypothetical protein
MNIFSSKLFSKQAGVAALLTTLLVLGICFMVVLGIGFLALNEQKISRNFLKSAQAYLTADSGVEDSLYRLIKNKNYEATNSLDIDGSVASISISQNGSDKMINVNGEKDNRFRSLGVILKTDMSAVSFFYGVQVGEGGLTMSNNSRIDGSIYSNGSVSGGNGAMITGDVWVASKPTGVNQESAVNNSDFIFGQTTPRIDAAQSFTPSATDRLLKVSLNLKKTGLPGNKTVRILTDNNGSPSKNLVASGAYGTLSASQISQSSYNWVDVTLNTPPLLSGGTKYWIAIDVSSDSSNYFWWGQDSNDAYSGGTGKYSANWNASNPVWNLAGGDGSFRAWLGGVSNTLSNLAIGGSAHANTINACDIIGDAYFQTILSSTVGGTQYPGSPDPGMENMPISESNITGWKADAETGGIFNGNYILTNNEIGTLGPKKINGNLGISNGADLTVTGTIYVTGSVNISNNAIIRLGANYGDSSGILLTDGSISVSNGSIFYANGEGTYLMFLSTKTGDAIDISNNTNTAIFYAAHGQININNNAILKEVTGYSINLANGAQIIYESGLASVKFSSGSGATWTIDSWRETE